MCMFNQRTPEGDFVCKRSGAITSNTRIAARLCSRCGGSHDHTHVLGQCAATGQMSQWYAVYTKECVGAALSGFAEELKQPPAGGQAPCGIGSVERRTPSRMQVEARRPR